MNNLNKKLNFTLFVFGLLAFTVLVRAFFLQVIKKDELNAYSKSQTIRETLIYPNRANILDRNEKPLAINISSYSIFVLPKEIKSSRTLDTLFKIIHGKRGSSYKDKVKGRLKFTWLERQISLTDSQVKRAKQLQGVYLEKSVKRFYPNGKIMSQLVGAVGVDNKGLSGVEFLFDQKLRGNPKRLKYVKDAKGRAVKIQKEDTPMLGESLILSLDKDIQGFVEKSLEETVKEFDAIAGGVGVMDVETGEIVALANYPTFDPNSIKSSDVQNMKVPFVTDPFEPGSVFKVFTVGSAIENKKANKRTNYFCERGSFLVDGHTINEAESKKKYEWLTVQEILRHSSNIGTTKIAFDVGLNLLERDFKRLGIGKKTGIELPGESRGIVKFDDKSRIRLSNLSFGQGIATTGIQILAAYSAIANGGMYQSPTIIKNGNIDSKPKRVFSKSTVDQIEEMLVDSVYNGTGSGARIEHFQIAGKTSTAQKPSKEKGYEGYIPAFIGYPTNVERRFVTYVYIDSPQGKNYYGNVIAAPLFNKVTSYILYKDKKHFKYAIKKTISSTSKFDKLKSTRSSRKLIKKGIVPNLIGLDKKSAINILNELKVAHSLSGVGIVKKQSLSPGSSYEKGQKVVLQLGQPEYE